MPQWLDDILETVRDLSWYEVLAIYVVAALVIQFVITRVILLATRKTKTSLDDQAVSALRRPLFLTVLFIGVKETMEVAAIDPDVVRMVARILATIAVFVWMRALARVSDAVLDAMARRADDFMWINARSLPLFEISAKVVIIGGAIYAIMVVWQKDLTGWLASAGILGIAIGFAAKDTLANLFAGIFILADAPYKLGDFIVLESGERGKVTDIGIRSTRILTRDDIEITIPNGVMANSKIINETSGPHVMRRLRVNVGVAYGSDVDRVKEVLAEAARDSGILAATPPPSVRFRAFGDSALDFQVRGFIQEPVLHGRAVDRVCTAVYKALNEAGIEIPFPQHVVHMQSGG
jgi:small-conductance mechanosensitive channel